MKIAICDDEEIYREHTIKACKAYFQETNGKSSEVHDIMTFASGTELMNSTEEFDVLFLDVEMPESDGIHIKEHFERNRIRTRIIFLTSHDERALEAFGRNVLYFLKKPINIQEFKKAMDKVMEDMKDLTLEVEENGEIITILIPQIKYVEAQDKYTMVFTKAGNHMFRKTMKFWEEQLPNEDFVRIHKSFIVNFKYFVKENNEVVLEKNKRIKISRKNKEHVMNQYKEYLRRKVELI